MSDDGGITLDAGADDQIILIPGSTGVDFSAGELTHYTRETIDDTDNEVLDATTSGGVWTNIGDADGQTFTLPGAAAGLQYTFVVIVAQNLIINPVDGVDTILGLTNAAGDSITSSAIGDTITLLAVDATNWVVTASNNSNGNADAWADTD